MSFLQELKEFVSRGSVMDMAIGIILGASFSQIVDVLVKHILMPPLGILMGGIHFSSLKITLQPATATNLAVTIDYGLFINSIVNFFIVGSAVFILIKVINKISPKTALLKKQNCKQCKMVIPAEARRCGYCTSVLEP